MFIGETEIDMFQQFDHNYPLIFLTMLLFSESETQAIKYVQDIDFPDLIRPQRQFANLNTPNINIFNRSILESITLKREKSNGQYHIMFYKISKLFMDLNRVMRYQKELREMQEKYNVLIEKQYYNVQAIVQEIIDHIGCQHD